LNVVESADTTIRFVARAVVAMTRSCVPRGRPVLQLCGGLRDCDVVSFPTWANAVSAAEPESESPAMSGLQT